MWYIKFTLVVFLTPFIYAFHTFLEEIFFFGTFLWRKYTAGKKGIFCMQNPSENVHTTIFKALCGPVPIHMEMKTILYDYGDG